MMGGGGARTILLRRGNAFEEVVAEVVAKTRRRRRSGDDDAVARRLFSDHVVGQRSSRAHRRRRRRRVGGGGGDGRGRSSSDRLTKRDVLSERPSVVAGRRGDVAVVVAREAKHRLSRNLETAGGWWARAKEQLDSATKSATVTSRKRFEDRKGPVMDAHWWRWNIALAMTPALFLALLFESVDEEMNEYFDGFERAERERARRTLESEEKEYDEYDDEELDGDTEATTLSERASEPESSSSSPELVEDLRQRISLLERRMRRQRRTVDATMEKDESRRRHQSGVRNRREDALLSDERERRRQKNDGDDDDGDDGGWKRFVVERFERDVRPRVDAFLRDGSTAVSDLSRAYAETVRGMFENNRTASDREGETNDYNHDPPPDDRGKVQRDTISEGKGTAR